MCACYSVYSDSVMVWEKDGEPVQGLDVSRWSEKRVQIDFSNRLVFYSLQKEDEGHYRCIVDLELKAMYHIKGLNETSLTVVFVAIIVLLLWWSSH